MISIIRYQRVWNPDRRGCLQRLENESPPNEWKLRAIDTVNFVVISVGSSGVLPGFLCLVQLRGPLDESQVGSQCQPEDILDSNTHLSRYPSQMQFIVSYHVSVFCCACSSWGLCGRVLGTDLHEMPVRSRFGSPFTQRNCLKVPGPGLSLDRDLSDSA